MPKMKVNLGTPSARNWVVMDANDLDTVDGLHFRVVNGKLEYSTNGTTWIKAS